MLHTSSTQLKDVEQNRHICAKLIDIIRLSNIANFKHFLPLYIGGEQMGWLHQKTLDEFANPHDFFELTPTQVILKDKFKSDTAKTEAMNFLTDELSSKGVIRSTRDELCDIFTPQNPNPLFQIRRQGVPYFGLHSSGIHLIGFQGHGDSQKIWVTKRAKHKDAAAGKLDILAGGARSAGYSIFQTMLKESNEEAGLDEVTLRRAIPTGSIDYCKQNGLKLRRATIYSYELETHSNFKPFANDGEVEEFYLIPIQELMEKLNDPDTFKHNSVISLAYFLVRHGHIAPDELLYTELCRVLHNTNAW